MVVQSTGMEAGPDEVVPRMYIKMIGGTYLPHVNYGEAAGSTAIMCMSLAVYFVIKEGETKPGEVGSATATGDAYHRGKSRKSTK